MRLTKEQLDSVAGMSSRDAARVLGVGKSTINDARARLGIKRELPQARTVEEVERPDGYRLLAFDLETSPNLADVWGLFKQNIGINQLRESTRVLCFGARWYGSDEVIFRSEYHDGRENMIAELHRLFDEADAVMGWNSKGFDHKHVNREFLEYGMLPPSPTKDLDLMLEVKRTFRFPSNKLDYVAQKLGVGAKVKHSGHELWTRCMMGDPEAWEEMKQYQVQDVNLLIELLDKLRPWIRGPQIGLYSGDEVACPNCGSTDLHRRGYAYTTVSAFQRFVCTSCGAWSRGASRVGTTALRTI